MDDLPLALMTKPTLEKLYLAQVSGFDYCRPADLRTPLNIITRVRGRDVHALISAGSDRRVGQV